MDENTLAFTLLRLKAKNQMTKSYIVSLALIAINRQEIMASSCMWGGSGWIGPGQPELVGGSQPMAGIGAGGL